MQQILKFKIEMFDVRMRTSISIVDDTDLVRNLQINKSTTLNNVAQITFAKSRSYKLLNLEEILKLYNYVKIEMEVIESNPSNLAPDQNGQMRGDVFYFSGFISTINKANNFGKVPSAAITITIEDYASLLKTTFYTKNLTFLEILNQAVPDFRLISLTEFLGPESKKLIDNFYSPAQLGFVFFAFLFFKFMYRITYDEDSSGKMSEKRTSSPDSQTIFKKFKFYTPFNFDLGAPYGDSFLKGQEQTLTIYKQLQGVALDLFKYIYPEPIFEFSTYETKDSVILMVRFTPLMSFTRPTLPPQNISVGDQDENMPGIYMTKAMSTQGSTFSPNSYKVINRHDFGHDRIKAIRDYEDISPASKLRQHLNQEGLDLIPTLQNSIGTSKGISIDDLIANDTESDEITQKLFNEIELNSDYIETLNMTRAANSVVNVIWTVPTTDTAVLKMSGRELVYAYLEQRLDNLGGADQFGSYVYQQFNPDFNPNPMFLMDYRNIFGQDFVSGDINYFGFREFEIKWNYLSQYYSAAAHVLTRLDTNVLKEAKKICKDKQGIKIIDNAISALSIRAERSKTVESEKAKRAKQAKQPGIQAAFGLPTGSVIPKGKSTEEIFAQYRQTVQVQYINKKQSQNKRTQINDAISEQDFQKALKRLGINQSDLKSAQKVVEIILKYKEENDKLVGEFVSKINGVVGEAYRENEHLYDCNMVRPITLTILPGMIVSSTSASKLGKIPLLKGYVTSISHVVDFNAASMKTQINISRTASDDSGVEAKLWM